MLGGAKRRRRLILEDVAARWARGGHEEARADARVRTRVGQRSTRPLLSVWVGPLSVFSPLFCSHGCVQTHANQMGQPAEDALREASESYKSRNNGPGNLCVD
jgi:hypothetical protein